MTFKYTAETIRIPDHKANGALVRAKRESVNISLRSLASIMGHSAAYQSDMELGKRAISFERFAQMAAFLEAKR